MPKLPDDESDVDNGLSPTPEAEVDDIPATASEKNGASIQNSDAAENGVGSGKDGEGEDDDNDDGDGEPDEYEVESVIEHKFNKKGVVSYRVRWKGYTETDDTWEPEDNLLPASRHALAEYHTSIGGKPELEKKTRKRKVESASTEPQNSPNSAALAKRTKRSSKAANSETPEDFGSWKPKDVNWDDLIDEIETVERDDNGNLRAFIRFKNGRRTKVGQNLYYQHCPRRMLSFYEQHLSV